MRVPEQQNITFKETHKGPPYRTFKETHKGPPYGGLGLAEETHKGLPYRTFKETHKGPFYGGLGLAHRHNISMEIMRSGLLRWMWGLCLLLGTGCYRPARLPLQPMLQPWLEPATRGRSRQSVSPRVEVLGLREVVYHLLYTSPRLRSIRAQQRAILAQRGALSLFQNPELRVMGLSSALARGDIADLSIRLRWRPPFPSADAARRDLLAASAGAQFQRLRQAQYRLLAEARRALVALQYLDAKRRLWTQRVQLAKARLRWERQRQRVGTTTALVVATWRMAWIEAVTALQRLEDERAQRKRELLKLLGVHGPCRVQGAALAKVPVGRQQAIVKLLQQALKRSPTLRALQLRYRARSAALWLEQSKRIPWFSFLQFSYGFGQNAWPEGFFLGVGMTLPIFNWNTGQIRYQKAQMAAIQAQARAAVAVLVAAVRAAYGEVLVARKALSHYQQQIKPQLVQSIRLLQRLSSRPGVSPVERWKLQARILRLQLQESALMLRLRRAQIKLDLVSYAPIWERLGVKLPTQS